MMTPLSILSFAVSVGYCHVVTKGALHAISNGIQEYIAFGCYDEGSLDLLNFGIETALRESRGSPLDFNFLIPDQPNGNILMYPVAVVRTPEKLEMLVKKGGALLEWMNHSKYAPKVAFYAAMQQAISRNDVVMFKKIMELGGSLRPCNSTVNLLFEICVEMLYSTSTRSVELLEIALSYQDNKALLEFIGSNCDGWTCLGFVLQCTDEHVVVLDTIRVLLDAGADPFNIQKDDSTPIDYLLSTSDPEFIVTALKVIFLEHPQHDPFHTVLTRGRTHGIDEVIDLARRERLDSALRVWLLRQIFVLFHLEPLQYEIEPYLLLLYLKGIY